jgi:hypothetical protein
MTAETEMREKIMFGDGGGRERMAKSDACEKDCD